MTDLPQYTIEDVAKIAGIHIPDSAYEVQVHAEMVWLDGFALIKFKLPPNDLPPFLEENGFSDLQEGYWSIQDFAVPGDWWPNLGPDHLPPISRYLGGEFNFPEEGFSRCILIDVTNQGVYTVYVQYTEQ